MHYLDALDNNWMPMSKVKELSVQRRRPGRPRSAFPLRYQLRLTAEQMRAWQDAAARDGRELQNWIRWTLDRAAKVKR